MDSSSQFNGINSIAAASHGNRWPTWKEEMNADHQSCRKALENSRSMSSKAATASSGFTHRIALLKFFCVFSVIRVSGNIT
ncbi:MAG: hypothetical protein ACKO7B_17495, partial [Flavobacteriales bacterium]